MTRIWMAGLGLIAATWMSAAAAAPAPPTAPRDIGPATSERPHPIPGGFDLPNGWRITPVGEKLADTGDLVMRLLPAPDGKAVIAVNSGYQPHGLTVLDPATGKVVQRIALKSSWIGLAWSPDKATLYVSGGNAAGPKATPTAAPIYAFTYSNGRLSEAPTGKFDETIPLTDIWWSGVARHPTRPLLYAANQGVDEKPTNVVVFDTTSGKLITRIPVEISPYQLVLSKDGSRLFVSNWSSNSVSVIDTAANRVVASIKVGANPNDMALAPDGRLFVACASDNTVHVIDTRSLSVVERLSTTMSPLAPEGSTPNALTLDPARGLLFAANADNNAVAVIDIHDRAHSDVVGFIPTGWYPSALAVSGGRLCVGASKGEAAYPDPKGPHSPLSTSGRTEESIKTLQTGSPYIRRGTVDSTLYSTSSLVRTMELLLGLPPMSQYDAAATPLYAAFGTEPDLTPYTVQSPQVDLNVKNLATAYGAAASGRMDFAEDDRAPMHQLNEIIWKSVMGPDSPMPPPVHRYRALVDLGEVQSSAK